MGRCIECKSEFNRNSAKDKLRCQKCAGKTESPSKDRQADRTLKAQLEALETKRRCKGTG